MKAERVIALCILLLLISGCSAPLNQETGGGVQNSVNNGTGAGSGNASSGLNVSNSSAPVKYSNISAKSFTTFIDPREGAFSLEVPADWVVSNGSGVIRPYIDAGVAFEAKSLSGQGFFFQDPYGYVYATPNAVLNYAGFVEGSLYNPSEGVASPMMVKKYATASEFASELLQKSGLNASNVNLTERPDLLSNASPMISRQSAAELTFEYEYGEKRMKSTVLVRTSLVEMSGTGVWSVSVMEYYAPVEISSETELLALNMQRSFKVNSTWAAREQEEVRKRLGILAQSQSDISEIISSTFEMRSRTMDELNRKWDKYILDIEDVYDPDTGEHYIVDSGSRYYWIDDRGRIYGTEIAESPFPKENLRLLNCPEC